MTIGIDITPLLFWGTGVANYTYQLVKNLLLIDKKNQYKLFFASLKNKSNYFFLKEFETLDGKIFYYRLPFKVLEFLWQKNNLIPIDWFIGKTDIFYANDYLRSPSKTKTITTIHDLTWKIYPEYHTEKVIQAHTKKLEKTIKYGDEIIVDSFSTKNDLLKFYPQIDEKKVHFIYPGISDHFKKISDKKITEKIINKYLKTTNYKLLTTNYLLYVGAIEPRKNLETAIKVFYQLITNPPKSEPVRLTKKLDRLNEYRDWYFFIIGKAGWKNEKVFQLVKDLNLEEKVKFLGYVEDQDLPYFYNGAKLTLYLSSYEGFGLPPLESLACGTPVLAGDNSSMKETLPKDFLVDVDDREEVLKKMIKLLNNPPKINSETIQKKFSWKNSAEKFLEVIEEMKNKI